MLLERRLLFRIQSALNLDEYLRECYLESGREIISSSRCLSLKSYLFV